MIFIGLAGYILPIPSLIWAWVRWLKSEPRFATPKWRGVLAFCGLILVSGIGLSVLMVAFHSNRMPEGDAKYAFAVASARLGFWTSVSALSLSAIGKGRVCAPVALASISLAALWVIGLVMY